MKKAGILAVVFAVCAAFAANVYAEKPGQKDAKYLGEKKCKMCHKKQHETWSASKHATNFSSLQGDEKKDPACLSCHTTGFGKGGYDVSKTAEENALFENTQCEACHGPGGNHMKAPKEEKPNTIERVSTACSGCHDPHKSFGEEAKAKRGG